MKKRVAIYTVGACSGNPSPGGWAAILVCGQTEKEISGAETHTTNNRMELMVAIAGLEALRIQNLLTVASGLFGARFGW